MTDVRNHWNLHTTPFTCEVPIDKRLRAAPYDEPLERLKHTVELRMSAALIGPAGTGKTVLLRALREELPEARYHVHYVKVTDLSKRDMCRELATVVGATPAGTYPALVRKVQDSFLACYGTDGLRPVLVIDEAHDMRPDVLGMIRLLTNFEMDSKLVVSVIISGQPKLKRTLERDDLSDIARRLAHCITLRPLSREETAHYVAHRLTIAGGDDLFAPDALDALYEIGRGNLRATDLLALRSLEVACLRGDRVVGSSHVAEARKMVVP